MSERNGVLKGQKSEKGVVFEKPMCALLVATVQWCCPLDVKVQRPIGCKPTERILVLKCLPCQGSCGLVV